MKKTYVKPEAIFEDFELSASIAMGCKVASGHSMTGCPVEIPGVGKLFSANQNCKYKYELGEGDAEFCYHNPSDSLRLFTS